MDSVFFFVKTELFITKINKTVEIQNSTEIYSSTLGENFIESLLYLSRKDHLFLWKLYNRNDRD